jgi:hypothetical protein
MRLGAILVFLDKFAAGITDPHRSPPGFAAVGSGGDTTISNTAALIYHPGLARNLALAGKSPIPRDVQPLECVGRGLSVSTDIVQEGI